jgi:hypothetical protein
MSRTSTSRRGHARGGDNGIESAVAHCLEQPLGRCTDAARRWMTSINPTKIATKDDPTAAPKDESSSVIGRSRARRRTDNEYIVPLSARVVAPTWLSQRRIRRAYAALYVATRVLRRPNVKLQRVCNRSAQLLSGEIDNTGRVATIRNAVQIIGTTSLVTSWASARHMSLSCC